MSIKVKIILKQETVIFVEDDVGRECNINSNINTYKKFFLSKHK